LGLLLVSGAQLLCSFGTAPGALTVLPQKKVLSGSPVCTITDMIPMSNIAPFGMCVSLANPAVSAATAAALGVLTPQPCVPATAAPWAPGCPKTLAGGVPVVDNASTLPCSYGGVISVLNPGQTKTTAG
jgi:hypothetical protein